MPVLAAAFLLLALPASASDSDAAAERVRGFVEAFRAGDVAAIRSLWMPTPERSRFLAALDRRLRVRCVTVPRAEVESIDAAGDTVTARVSFGVVEEPAGAATERYTLTLTRASGWKIVAVTSEADEIAAALAARRSTIDANALRADVDRALSRIAIADINRGDRARAKIVANLARDVATSIDDRAGIALAIAIGGALDGLDGRLDDYRDATRRAYRLAMNAGDPDVLARVINYIGRTDERAGDFGAAREEYARAAALSDQVADPMLVNVLLNSINKLELATDNLRGALRYEVEMFRAAVEQGDDNMAISTQIGVAGVFSREGDEALAAVHLQRALDIATRANNAQFRGRALMMLSHSWDVLGRDADSERALDEALDIARRIDDAVAWTESLKFRALRALRRKEYDAAMHDIDESLDICTRRHLPLFCSYQRTLRAEVLVRQGRVRDGLQAANDAAAHARTAGDTDAFIDAMTVAGHAHRRLGETSAALAAYGAAIDHAETMRSSLGWTERQQVLYFEAFSDAYRESIDLLVTLGKTEEALALAERAKGRTLLEILRAGRFASSLTAAERSRERELEEKLSVLNRELLQHPEQARATQARLDAARGEYDSYQTILHAAHATLRAERAEIEPATIHQIQTMLAPRSAVLEYVAGAERSLVFVVTRRAVRVHAIPIAAAELSRRVDALLAAVSRRDLAFPELAGAMAKALLPGAAERELADARVVGIVPDGPLWRLPFEALRVHGRYFIEEHAVFYTPSLSVLREVTKETPTSPSRTLLAVGNPHLSPRVQASAHELERDADLSPLPHAEDEVKALRRLYGSSSRLLVGDRATESQIKSELPRYRILHFATHGRFVDANPLYSYLVLAADDRAGDDGLLEARELMKSDLHSDLAVLSACETARGRVGGGEGIIGMSWALFVARCPTSVVSQWKVSSASTAELMVAFHRSLLAAGPAPFAKALALQKAKLHLLNDRRFRHPYYWSAFVLIGAPG